MLGLDSLQHIRISSIPISSRHGRRGGGEERQCLLVKIAKEPVNAMDLSLWTELSAVLQAAEKSFRGGMNRDATAATATTSSEGGTTHAREARVCGIIWSSGLVRNIFTAGNDINELHARKTTKQRYKHFWKVSNEFLARLYCSPLATVAAVKGSCPAGGCITSLCCDAIIMVDPSNSSSSAIPTIGLNEVALGIAVPEFWSRVFLQRVGHAKGEPLLKNAIMVPAREALAIGLVDQVVDDIDALLPASERLIQKMVSFPVLEGRAMTKASIRGQISEEWLRHIDNEAEQVWGFLSDEVTVRALDAVMLRLTKQKKTTANASDGSSAQLKPRM